MSIVIGKTSETRYELKAQSGRGMTAAVYEGTPEAGGGPSVAVKVAYERMSAEDKQLFWGELAMLGKLAGSNCVPKGAEKGEYLAQQNRDDSEKTGVIIQEWVPREWSLNQRISDAKDEALALAAASQYAGLLDFMFRHGVTTRGDRKLPDLHWSPSDRRLIVLDWNRAVADDLFTGEEEPAVLEHKLDEELRHAADPAERSRLRGEKDRLVLHRNHILTDIRLFARLWGQLLGLNSLDSGRLPDLEDETEWAGLSLGTRQILATAVQSRQSWGFQEPAQLKKAIDEHLMRLEVHAETLLTKAQELKELVTNLPLWKQIEKAEIVLILIDMIERKGQIAKNNYELTDLRNWANDLIKDTDKRFSEKVRIIYYYLNLLLFDQASRIIAEAQSEFIGARAPMPYYQVILHRLHAAVAVGETGSRQLQLTDMEQRLQSLCSYLDALALATPHNGFVPDLLKQAAEKWVEVKIGFGEHVLDEMLKPLAIESKLWKAIINNNHDQIQERWFYLYKTNQSYATSLKAAYPSLDNKLDKWYVDDASQRILEERRKEFKKKVEDLRQVLHDCGNAEVCEWGDLSQFIRLCERAYYALLETTAEEEEVYSFVATTRNINDYLRRGELDHTLDELGKFNYDIDWPIVKQVAAETVLRQIIQRAKERGWPADLDDVQTLLEKISDQSKNYVIARECLATWEADLKQWREIISVTDENLEDRYNKLSIVSSNLKAEVEIDDCLEAAQAKNTELFQKPKLTIRNLIAKRESNRLKMFISSIDRLGIALTADSGVNSSELLKQKALEFWTLSSRIDSLLNKGEQLNFDTRINALIGRLDILHDLHYQLGVAVPDPTHTMADIKARLEEYDKQLELIKGRTDEWVSTINEINLETFPAITNQSNINPDKPVLQPSQVENPASIQLNETDLFATIWGNYQNINMNDDTPGSLKLRREMLDKLLNQPPQTTEQIIRIAQAEDYLQKREFMNKTLVELKKEWQDGNVGSVELDNALGWLENSDLMERTVEYLKGCRSGELPQAYVEPIQKPIWRISEQLKREKLQSLVEEGQEKKLGTALLMRHIARQFNHWTIRTASDPENRQPVANVQPNRRS